MNNHHNNLIINVRSFKSVWEISWQVRDFHNLPHAAGESLKSAEFETNGGKYKWQLELFPKGADDSSVILRSTSVFLRCTNGAHTEMPPTKIEIGIRHITGTVWYNKSVNIASGQFVRNFAKRTLDRTRLVPNGHLTIVCEIHTSEGMETAAVENIPPPASQFAENLCHMWENKIFTDCTLISSDEKEFQAHMNILASQSHVFEAMFQDEDGVTEDQNKRVKLEDIRGEVVEQMLRFIYTNMAPNVDAMLKELLAASDKYELKRLNILCDRALSLSLSVENACELLALADLHSAVHLKSEAIQFIQSHVDEVRNSDGWNSLSKENLEQLFDAMALDEESELEENEESELEENELEPVLEPEKRKHARRIVYV